MEGDEKARCTNVIRFSQASVVEDGKEEDFWGGSC